MTIDIISLLEELGIAYSDRGENVGKGWVNITCPHCDDALNHLGIHIDSGACSCWRCGKHSTRYTLSLASGQSHEQIKRLWKKHGGKYRPHRKRREKTTSGPKTLKFPKGAGTLSDRHRHYLAGRGYDPEELVLEWGLLGTGPLGDYKFRIIAPIHHRGHLVSYQGRDITGKSALKYMPCRKENEVMPYKHTLYGYDRIREGRRILVLEGITDVWRVGPGAVATYGISFTDEQAALLVAHGASIMYDAEPQAQEQAHKLAAQLIDAEVLELAEGDPAEMNHKDIAALRNYLKL